MELTAGKVAVVTGSASGVNALAAAAIDRFGIKSLVGRVGLEPTTGGL